LRTAHKAQWKSFVEKHPKKDKNRRSVSAPSGKQVQEVVTPSLGASSIPTGLTPAKRKQSTLEQSLARASRTELDAAIARMFATHSLPHRLSDSPEFQDVLSAARKTTALAPSTHRVRSTILSEAEMIQRKVVAYLRDSGPCTIVLDGWTNVRHNKVTNLLLADSRTAFFFYSVENSDEKNDVPYLIKTFAPRIDEMIAQVGVRHDSFC